MNMRIFLVEVLTMMKDHEEHIVLKEKKQLNQEFRIKESIIFYQILLIKLEYNVPKMHNNLHDEQYQWIY